MSGMSQERAAQNEALFRSVNEHVRSISARWDGDVELLSLVCECERESCFEQVRVPTRVYEQVRAEPDRFILVPGHADAAIEHVVESRPAYVIVEKEGVAASIAVETDPRR